jgi:hypothetical protein
MFESLIESTYEKLKQTYDQAKAVAEYASNFDGSLTGSVGVGGQECTRRRVDGADSFEPVHRWRQADAATRQHPAGFGLSS